jgi:hypothetical protein
MALITESEKNKLYLRVKHELGHPLRPFEINDDMMNSYFEMVVEDYSSLLNSWLIQQQWIGLEGLSRENSDFISAYTTKSNNYMESYTYAYSKQVGLGTNAPASSNWELKRDYITISANTQHYIIPANREVNEVLWETPPEIDSGLVDPFSMNAWSAGAMGWSVNGRPSQYLQPVYSTLLAAQDRSMKQRMLKSTLTYRITGLASGEKMLHLYPIPGSRYEIGNVWGKSYTGRKIYYWYYDTNKTGRDKCLEENDDIVKLPSDPITKILKWDMMNDVAHQQIRNLLIAKVKMVIGGIRGFFEGKIGMAEAQLSMDYRHLLDEGTKLKEDTEKIILDQLEKLKQVNLTEERAKIAENVNKERGYQPFRTPLIPI